MLGTVQVTSYERKLIPTILYNVNKG